MRPQERNDGAFYARQQEKRKNYRKGKPQRRMHPKGWLAAVALEHENKWHDNVADCENREIRRRIIGTERLQAELAGGAVAVHLEEAREQPAGATARALAAPAAPQTGPDVRRAFLFHPAKMELRPIGVVATVCPFAPRAARPDAAACGDLGGDRQ